MNNFRFLPVAFALGGVALTVPHTVQAQNQTQAGQTQSATLLDSLFSDDGILQRDRVIPIWGQAAPGETVAVKLDDQTLTARPDASGQWMVRVGPLPASATPHTLAVSTPTQTVTRHNIVYGDVWICSGQSNMEWGIGNLPNAKDEIRGANYPNIRLFTVAHKVAFTPQTGLGNSRWLVCNPANVAANGWNGFSAVGYFFGRKLNQELGVPIGLIESAVSGTIGEAWVSQSALGTMPDFKPELARVAQAVRDQNVPLEQRTESWLRQSSPDYRPDWATADADVSKWKTAPVPGNWGGLNIAGLDDAANVALFRREVEVPADWAGHDLQLQVGAIDDSDTTYWNGVAVGSTNGWNTQRKYTIPAAQVKAGRNILAVRVTNNDGDGGLSGPADSMRLTRDANASLPLAGDWKFLLVTTHEQLQTAPLSPDQGNANITSALYNGMIAPLVPFGVKGAIWYQGEQNAGRAEQYSRLLPTLIRDWRSKFGEQMPFYIVQLAGFMAPDESPRSDDWPQLRAAQSKTALTVPNTGIAITTDIGDEKDIHPKDKQDVGLRLALDALAQTYGEKVEYSGPTVQKVTPQGNSVAVSFAHAQGGLNLKGDDTNRVFAVAGADRNWFWATPRIEGNRVILTSAVVPNPMYVRYAWSNLPRATLSNGAGLPAPPF